MKHCCKLRTSSSYRISKRSVLVVGLSLLAELSSDVADLQIKILLWRATKEQVPPCKRLWPLSFRLPVDPVMSNEYDLLNIGLQPGQTYFVTDSVLQRISGLQNAEGQFSFLQSLSPHAHLQAKCSNLVPVHESSGLCQHHEAKSPAACQLAWKLAAVCPSKG